MSSPAGLLDFFIREAADYVDRLRALLAEGLRDRPVATPDGDAFARAARAMRGAATMARLDALAELAGALERLGRETAAGRLVWDVPVHEAAAAGVDDLRELLHATRHWASADDERARARAAAVRRVLPADAVRATPTGGVPALSAAFVADELESIARALDQQADSVGRATALADAAARARALRGVAGIDELQPLGEVIDAVERATSMATPRNAGSGAALLVAAARLLARAAGDLRAGGRPAPASAEAHAFAAALAASRATEQRATPTTERVVPIETLFYADAGPHVVERGDAAASSRDARLRAELVAHGEHLRRLVGDARTARDPVTRERTADAIRTAARTLVSTAASYGAAQVVRVFEAAAAERDPLEPLSLAALDAAAEHLADRAADLDRLGDRLAALVRERTMASALARGFARVPIEEAATDAPAPTPTVRRATPPPTVATPASAAAATLSAPAAIRSPTPTGRELHDLLSHGLDGLRGLEHEPLSPPALIDDLAIVPIDSLLYRGRAALVRALELRDEIRSRGGAPDAESLGELFDLLDLAAAE